MFQYSTRPVRGLVACILLPAFVCAARGESWMDRRLDSSRAEAARKIARFIIRNTADGRYVPAEAQYNESIAYRAELAATLAIAGRMLQEPDFIRAARTMMDRVLGERVDGVLWSFGYWAAFPIYQGVKLDWRELNAVRAPHYTNPLVLYSLGVYHRISGDDRMVEPARAGLAEMFKTWDYVRDKETMHEFTPETAALAALIWEHKFPEYARIKEPIVAWTRDTFRDRAPSHFPFYTAIRTMLLLAATGTEHLRTSIQPAIDAFLAQRSWRYAHNEHYFRHLLPLDQHVDVRGNASIAITMRLFDLAAGETVYTATPTYRALEAWMDAMRRPDGGVYGCEHIQSGQKYCLGSPPHYIQLWWILGGFLP
jgi:hypothetical protein